LHSVGHRNRDCDALKIAIGAPAVRANGNIIQKRHFRLPGFVREVRRRVTAERLAPDLKSLVPIQSEGSQTPFFAIHGVYGKVVLYIPLTLLLGRDQPFYALQSQGLDGSQIRQTTIEALAVDYIEEIRKVREKGPYLLGGYSFGGVVAYEIACRLKSLGEDVPLVALFDTVNPAKPRRRQKLVERAKKRLNEIASMAAGQRFRYLTDRVRGKIDIHINKMREDLQMFFHQKKAEIVPEYLRRVSISAAHEKMLDNYRPGPFSGRLTLFRAEYSHEGFEYLDDLGWSAYAEQGLEIIRVPGSHGVMFKPPQVNFVAAKLRAVLQSATRTQRIE
jgi:thioesterase domain-containing protein